MDWLHGLTCSCHGLTAAGAGEYLFWWCSCLSKLPTHENIAFCEVRVNDVVGEFISVLG